MAYQPKTSRGSNRGILRHGVLQIEDVVWTLFASGESSYLALAGKRLSLVVGDIEEKRVFNVLVGAQACPLGLGLCKVSFGAHMSLLAILQKGKIDSVDFL